MSHTKITIAAEDTLLKRIDRLIEKGMFTSRSQAVRATLHKSITKSNRRRLARECAKLDRNAERAMADECLSSKG